MTHVIKLARVVSAAEEDFVYLNVFVIPIVE